MSRSCGR